MKMRKRVKTQRMKKKFLFGELQLQAFLKANAATTVQNAVKAGMKVMLLPQIIVAKTRQSIGIPISATTKGVIRMVMTFV